MNISEISTSLVLQSASLRTAGGLARLGGEHALLTDALRVGGVLFEPDLQTLAHDRGDEPLDLGVAQFALGLAFELGVGEFDGDDGGEAFAQVVAAGHRVFLFHEAGRLGVVVEHACEGGLEAREMRSAVDGLDVVGEGEEEFVVAVVVLEGDLADEAGRFVLAAQEDGGRVGVLGLVEVLDELEDALVELEGLVARLAVGADALVDEADDDARVEVGEFAQARGKDGRVEGGVGEDLVVGLEGDGGAGLARGVGVDLGDDVEGLVDLPSLEGDEVDLAGAADLDLDPFGEGVDAGDADAVEAARDFVGRALFAELAAGVEDGHDDLDGGLAVEGGVLVAHGPDGDARAVVDDAARAVGLDLDGDGRGAAGHALVDGVVDGLVDEVVESGQPGVADVHARPLADRLKPLEDLDLVLGVVVVDGLSRGLDGVVGVGHGVSWEGVEEALLAPPERP
jgi:hypothetical protein